MALINDLRKQIQELRVAEEKNYREITARIEKLGGGEDAEELKRDIDKKHSEIMRKIEENEKRCDEAIATMLTNQSGKGGE